MDKELEILDYTGEGYSTVMRYERWRVAFLNYAPRFDGELIERVERHMLTDEVFVLLEGEATLIIGESETKYPMERHKIYNVKAGVWHAVAVSRDAKILIVENEDTSPANTEYREKRT